LIKFVSRESGEGKLTAENTEKTEKRRGEERRIH